jgi:hypothetical protein
MKYICIALIVLLSATSPLLAKPTHNLTFTVHRDGSNDKDDVYQVSNFDLQSTISMPVYYQGKNCILTAQMAINDDKSKSIKYSIQDPSIVIPGGGTNTGYAQYILNITFPYTTKEIRIFSGDGITLSAIMSETKE